MQSTSSMASDESRTVNLRGSEPAFAGQENEKMSGLATPPTATGVEDAQEEDPFMVQLDKNDPRHARVRIFHLWLRPTDVSLLLRIFRVGGNGT